MASGMAGAQHHLQTAVQAASPHMSNAISKLEMMLTPHVSQAQAFIDAHATPGLKQLQPKLQHMQARLQQGFQHSTARIDASLHGLQPWQIAAVTAVLVLIAMWALSRLGSILADVRETGKWPNSAPLSPWFRHASKPTQALLLLPDLAPSKAALLWRAGYLQSIIDFLKTLPGIRGLVEREHSKMMVTALLLLSSCHKQEMKVPCCQPA